MAITKTDFYKQSLNQFMPNRVRGEMLDWGLSGEVIEAQIDVSQETPLYAGDPVKILPTSNLNNGNCHIALTALAVSDLPQPGTPVIKTPFGAGKL